MPTTVVHNMQTWQKFSKAAHSYLINTVNCSRVKQL